MKNLYLFFARFVPQWGFSLRLIPFSKSRPALKIPAVTTFIGALSYGLAKILGWGENIKYGVSLLSSSEKIRKFVVSVNARILGIINPYSDINRIYWMYRGQIKFDAVALEKVYLSPDREEKPIIDSIFIINGKKAEQILGKNWKEFIESALWIVPRIGQKESLVSAIDVFYEEITEDKIIKAGTIPTSFYFPSAAAKSVNPAGSNADEYMLVEFVDHFRTQFGDYTDAPRIPYVIPYSKSHQKWINVNVTLSEEGLAIYSRKLDDYIIFLRRWVS